MTLSTQSYKGSRDFYPEDKRLQKYMFGMLRQVAESFGYLEYDAPLIEPIDIYLAKTGEEIIDEQLYSFEDKGGRKVAIRPEMTPSVSRMVAARRQELTYPLRWYSLPNLWRYERPQRGRLREHWQLNIDIFGVADVSADHEIILVADSILKTFGAKPGSYTIRVNSRRLVDHFLKEILKLNPQQSHETGKLMDRRRKLLTEEFESQATELLGSDKATQLVKLMQVKQIDELPEELRNQDFTQKLRSLMTLLEISDVKDVAFDTSIIRGLDYYNDIVFEVYDEHPDNNRALFGGGRYDGLVELFGVESLPVTGFGMGDVALKNFLELHKLLPKLEPEIAATVILIGDVYEKAQIALKKIRGYGLKLSVDSTDRKLDAKIKNAAKSGVKYVIFIGEQELKTSKFKFKNLQSGEEKELASDDLVKEIIN